MDAIKRGATIASLCRWRCVRHAAPTISDRALPLQRTAYCNVARPEPRASVWKDTPIALRPVTRRSLTWAEGQTSLPSRSNHGEDNTGAGIKPGSAGEFFLARSGVLPGGRSRNGSFRSVHGLGRPINAWLRHANRSRCSASVAGRAVPGDQQSYRSDLLCLVMSCVTKMAGSSKSPVVVAVSTEKSVMSRIVPSQSLRCVIFRWAAAG